jgi:hypothetical protein
MINWEESVRRVEKVFDKGEDLRPGWQGFVDLRGEQVVKYIWTPLSPWIVMDGVGCQDFQKADITRLAFDPFNSTP